MHHPTLATALAAALAVSLTACVPNDTATADTDSNTLTVRSTADVCEVSATTALSGTLTFKVTNAGTEVTEFYLLAQDGLRVISELENVGPGLTRDLVVQVKPGEYFTACKPGMVGEGIQAAFTVTDSGAAVGPTGDVGAQLEAAAQAYISYTKNEVEALLSGTEEFTAAYTSGDDDQARTLYPLVRMHFERVEPVAESFGEFDPLLDLREADLEEGQTWSGWHLIEKDLWPPADYTPLTGEQRTTAANDLVANTAALNKAVHADDFALAAFQIANGAKSLLDEVATGKITGEEETWSHTDLWDFQANLEGARIAYEVLRDVVITENPDLADELDTRFTELETALAVYGNAENGFLLYTELTASQIKDLSAKVDALSEPLSRLTTTVTEA